MKNQEVYNKNLDTFLSMNPDIVKICNKTKAVVSVFVLVVGIILLAYSSTGTCKSESLGMTMLAAGVALVVAAGIFLLQGCKKTLYQPSRSPLLKGVKFYAPAAEKCLTDLSSALQQKSATDALVESPQGCLRVEYAHDKAKTYLALSVSRYENLMYAPLGDVETFTGKEAEDVIRLLKINA